MNKETMQRLAEVLGLKLFFRESDNTLWIDLSKPEFPNSRFSDFENYFTLERMIRLAIEYMIDIEWNDKSCEASGLWESKSPVIEREGHNDSKEDAERALKEAIALCVIAIKENGQ